MFAGHYGPAYASKRVDPRPPLWVLFLAVQLMDVMWSIFVMTGVEKVRIMPGFMAMSPLDLYSMPYTHSLPGSLFWSAVAFTAYRLWRGQGSARSALVVGAAVFSHWVLDLLVHGPDLLLYPGGPKVGLGLWNHPAVEWPLELGILFVGLWIYMNATRPLTPAGRWAMPVFGVVLAGIQVASAYGPPPPTPAAVATTALSSYLLLAAVVAWLERKRGPRAAPAREPAAAVPAGAA